MQMKLHSIVCMQLISSCADQFLTGYELIILRDSEIGRPVVYGILFFLISFDFHVWFIIILC